jgi:hypothetical protein
LTAIVLKRRSAYARFFFDIHDSEVFTPDPQGPELKDVEAAKAGAKNALPDLLKDGERRGFTIDVKNAAGQIVWRVTLSLSVESPSQDSIAIT